MRIISRLPGVLPTAVMVSCLVVTSVTAAPSQDSLEEQKSAAESEAEDLQAQLTELLDKVGKMEEKLIETGEKITQTQSDLEEAQAKAEQQYADMKVRIKYMYENGESDLWEVFLEAKDFSDFLNKAEYVSNVHSYDRQQLEELKKTQNEIQELKDTLETEQASLESQQADYEEQETQLNAQLEETKAQIADYDEQIQAAAEAAAQEAIAREADNTDTASEESSGGATDGGSSSGGSGSTSNSGSTGSSSGNTSVAQTIVNAAYSQLGVPYVYGGTTAGVGFDCSGLVQYCHAVAGISLPRTSQAQGGCGIAVSDPQPGDLVCYGSHIGIYIGNGQMIHAPHTGDVVKIASVYGSPWYRRCW